MRKALLVAALAAAALMIPSQARADDLQEVFCGPTCWGTVFSGAIDPDKLPPGVSGGVKGGDGYTCSLSDRLDDCDEDNIYISPCATASCLGGDGDAGGIIICDIYCLRFNGGNDPGDAPPSEAPEWAPEEAVVNPDEVWNEDYQCYCGG